MGSKRKRENGQPSSPRPQKVVSNEEKVKKLWHASRDQLAGQAGRTFPQNALKSIDKILALEPDNEFALLTRVQLLAGLDRYKEAYELLTTSVHKEGEASTSFPRHPLELGYILYKLKRESEALEVIRQATTAGTKLDDSKSRGLRVLEAQILYRQKDYASAQSVFEDLLDGVEADHPEYADLQTNLSACIAHTEFEKSIPSRLAAMADELPSVQQLEAAPLDVLVAANASSRPAGAGSKVRAIPTDVPKRRGKKRKQEEKQPREPKLPAHIAAMPPDQRPAPDPERWLPKAERSGWAAKQQAEMEAREKKRAEKRKKSKLTQGSTTPSEPATPTAGSGGQPAKKRKGKK